MQAVGGKEMNNSPEIGQRCYFCGAIVPSRSLWWLNDKACCNDCFEAKKYEPLLKPTLGVAPHNLWVEQRIQALARALADRCNQISLHPTDADEKPIGDWALEIMKLRLQLKKEAE
jgi:hypothetical protein